MYVNETRIALPLPVHCPSLVGSSQSIVFTMSDDDKDGDGGTDHDDDDDGDDPRAGQRPMIARELLECHIDYQQYQHRIPPRDTFSRLSLTCSNFRSVIFALPPRRIPLRSSLIVYTFVLPVARQSNSSGVEG